MSERVLKTRLSLDGAKEFKNGLKSVNSELSVLKSEYKTLMSAFESGDKSVETITKLHENLAAQVEASKSKVEGLKDAVEHSNSEYEKAKQKLETAKQAYEEIAAAQGKNSDAAKKAQEEMIKAENVVKATEKEYDSYRKSLAATEAALNSSNAALEKFEQEQKEEADTIKEIEEPLDEVREHFQQTTEENISNWEKFKDVLKTSIDLSGLDDKFKSLGDKIGDLAKKAAELTFDAAKTSAKAFIDVTETGFKSGLQAVELYAETLTKAAKTIGTFAYSVGSEFESQMSTVASISGATGEEFDRLSAKAEEMGKTTSFSATESAKALEYMAMAGWSTNDMENGLQGIVYLAQASGEELATVSDIVTDSMTAFGMAADQSEYFANVLAKTASNANTNVGMMGETFKYVAPLAGAMGYSIEDMSAAIGLMANSGIKGSMSGTALRNIITNLATPTDEVAGAMETLGIALTNEDGTMKSFRETLDSMRAGFANLSEVEKAQYASTIAGQRGMSGLLAIVNSSDEDFQELTEKIHKCGDAAEEMSKIRLDNLAGDITLFKSALEGAGKKIYDEFSENLRDIVKDGNKIIDSFNENGIFSALDKSKEIFIKNLSEIEKNFSRIAPQIFGKFNKIITTGAEMLVSAMPLITKKALPALINGTSALVSEFVDMLPTLVPELADGAIILFNGIFDGLNKVSKKLLKQLPEITKNLADKLIENTPVMLDKALEFFAHVGEALAVAAGQLIPRIPEFLGKIAKTLTSKENIQRFKNVGKEFLKNLTDGFSGDNSVFKTVSENLANGFSSIFKAFENIDFSKLSESFGRVFDSLSPIIEKVGGLFEWLSENIIAPFIEWAGNDILPKLFDGLAASVDLLSGALDFLKTPALAVWEEFLQPVLGWTGDALAGAIGLVADALTGLSDTFSGVDWDGYWLDFENFGENWSVGTDSISDSLLNAEESINDFFNTSSFGESWNNFWQGVGEAVADIVEWVKESFKSAKESFKDFKDDWESGLKAIKKFFSDFKDNLTSGFRTIKNAIGSAVDYFADKVNWWLELFNDIENGFNSLVDRAWEWGSDIVDNFIGGIKSMWDEWSDTWEDFGGLIYDLLHHSTPEKGPLKDDDKWTKDMMDNFIGGITAKQGELQRTVDGTADIISELCREKIVPEIDFQISHIEDFSLPFMRSAAVLDTAKNSYNTSNYDNREIYAPVTVNISASINNDADIRTIAQGIARETQRNLAGIGVYE